MVIMFPDKTDVKLAEETGWHIGDGSMNFYKQNGKDRGIYQLRGHIDDDRLHYVSRIKPLFKELYNIDISLREMPSTRVFGFQLWNDELVRFKQKLGLCLGPKVNIEIPSIFLIDDDLKAAVIRGIFDTDGCVYLERKNGKFYPRLEIRTISLILANQLKQAYLDLKLRATSYQDRMKLIGNKKISYCVTIRGVEMFHKFMQIISPMNSKHIAKYKRFTQSFK